MKKLGLLVILGVLMILPFFVNAETFLDKCINEEPLSNQVGEGLITYINSLDGNYLTYVYDKGNKKDRIQSRYYDIYNLKTGKVEFEFSKESEYNIIGSSDKGLLLKNQKSGVSEEERNYYFYDFGKREITLFVEREVLAGGPSNYPELILLTNNLVLYASSEYEIPRFSPEINVAIIDSIGTNLYLYNPSTNLKEKVYTFNPILIKECVPTIECSERVEKEFKEKQKFSKDDCPKVCYDKKIPKYLFFLNSRGDKIYFSAGKEMEPGVNDEHFVYDINTKIVSEVELPKDLGQLSDIDRDYAIFTPYTTKTVSYSEGKKVISRDIHSYFVVNVWDMHNKILSKVFHTVDYKYLSNGKLIYTKSNLMQMLSKVVPLEWFIRFLTSDVMLADFYTNDEVVLPTKRESKEQLIVPSLVLYGNEIIYIEDGILKKCEVS